MDYRQYSAELPTRDRLVFLSPEENEVFLQSENIDQSVRHTGRGAFKAEIAGAKVALGCLFADRYEKAVSVDLSAPDDSVLILLVGGLDGVVNVSGQASNEGIWIMPPGTDVHIGTNGAAGSEAFIVPSSEFAHLEGRLVGGKSILEGSVPRFLEAGARSRSLIRGEMLDLLNDAGQDAQGERSGHLASEFAMLASAAQAQTEATQLSPCRRTLVACTARDYIEANYARAIKLEHLCEATSVTARTLQRSFKEYFGVPMRAYILDKRLDMAYRLLSAPEHQDVPIGTIAVQCGCFHFGRFSVLFKQRFGVSPREFRESTFPDSGP